MRVPRLCQTARFCKPGLQAKKSFAFKGLLLPGDALSENVSEFCCSNNPKYYCTNTLAETISAIMPRVNNPS